MSVEPSPHQLSRRAFIGRSAAVTAGLVALPSAILQACGPEAPPSQSAQPGATNAPAGSGGTGQDVSDFGVPYPADAAPKEYQFVQAAANPTGRSWETFDFYERVYARVEDGWTDHFSEGLVRMDKNLDLQPAQAQEWKVSDDGLSWTFRLYEGLTWSNGDEVTADDYVATFRYSAEPSHAWDFTWYWDGVIKNYGPASRGEVPTSEIGVNVGADKYEVVFTTEAPTPFLPKMLIWSQPLHAKSLAQYGSAIYNMDPATAVSNSPYLLEEFSPDRRIVAKANVNYTGKLKPLTNRLVANVVTGGSDLARYQAGEVDYLKFVSAADLKAALADPELKDQVVYSTGDFRTYYMFFDVAKAPFDDKRVRQAIAKAVDRNGIIEGILAPAAVPAYSFLMPGFPDSDSENLKSFQDFDPEAAKRLFAEAGFPNGEGFPPQTIQVLAGLNDAAVSQAVAASITQTLGIQIDLQTIDQNVFFENLGTNPPTWGWMSYGMDYLDATNMLGVWRGGGQHSWKNDEFDRLLTEAGPIIDDPDRRSEMMKAAERILVDEAPGVFVYHPLVAQLHKPYRKGEHLLPNRDGYAGAQWPGENMFTEAYGDLYQSAEVVEMRKS